MSIFMNLQRKLKVKWRSSVHSCLTLTLWALDEKSERIIFNNMWRTCEMLSIIPFLIVTRMPQPIRPPSSKVQYNIAYNSLEYVFPILFFVYKAGKRQLAGSVSASTTFLKSALLISASGASCTATLLKSAFTLESLQQLLKRRHLFEFLYNCRIAGLICRR